MVAFAVPTLSSCAIDGAAATDPVGAYIFLLLAIAAALYLLTQVGQAMMRVAQLLGELIVLVGRLLMFSVLVGAVLTIAACAALT